MLLSACDSEGGDSLDCADVGAHIADICGSFLVVFAEKVRHDCETFGMPTSDRLCVVRARTCDEDVLDGCNLHNRTWGCSGDDPECPPGLSCDLARTECVACMQDGDCDAGRFCLDGWCVDDTPEHRSLRELMGGQ